MGVLPARFITPRRRSGISGSSTVSSSAVMVELDSIKRSIEEGKLEIKQDIRIFTTDILLAIEKIQNEMGDETGGSTEEIKISADKIEENFTEIKNRCAELTTSSDEIKIYVGKLVDAVRDLKNSGSPKDKTDSIRSSVNKLKTSVESLIDEVRELKRSSSKSIRF